MVSLPAIHINNTLISGSRAASTYLLECFASNRLLLSSAGNCISKFVYDLSDKEAQESLKSIESLINDKKLSIKAIDTDSVYLFSNLQASFDCNISNILFIERNFPIIHNFYISFKAENNSIIENSLSQASKVITKSFKFDLPCSYPLFNKGYPVARELSLFFNTLVVQGFPFLSNNFTSSLEEGKAVSKTNSKSKKQKQPVVPEVEIVPDFQYSAALKIFGQMKSLKGELKETYSTFIKSPKDVANFIVSSLEDTPEFYFLKSTVIDKLEVSGPGFINIYLKESFGVNLASQILKSGDIRRAKPELSNIDNDLVRYLKEGKYRVGLDMSSPNVAKEMHVGHLRSTIIGEVLSRVLKFKGHEVFKINHIGDWGTQFGMLLCYLKDTNTEVTPGKTTLTELNVSPYYCY